MRRLPVLLASLVLALSIGTGCGRHGAESTGGAAGTPAGAPAAASREAATPPPAASAPAGSTAAAAPWVDPEPPGAQATAESAVAADWNRDKTTELRAETTALQMEITTLVDRTSGIAGFGSALVAKESSLQDRLAKLNAEETATEVIIRLPGAVLFDFDSAAIRPDAERTLQEVATVLASYRGRPVRLEGHTDAIATEDYNLKLSERRAQAVRNWLAGHGAEAGRLRTKGFGKSHPIADNSTAEGRQKNRRVEVIVEKKPG
jgi:outer membrane protein OmpA-like peptidoglycan-associated protein